MTRSKTISKVIGNQSSNRTLEKRGFELVTEKRKFKAQGDVMAREHNVVLGWKHPDSDKIFTRSEAFQSQLGR